MLDKVNDSIVLIQIDQVERNQYPHGMHTPGGHQPDAFIAAELQPSDKPSQARKNGISGRYREAQEGFAGLVINAIGLSLHSSAAFGEYGVTGPSLTALLRYFARLITHVDVVEAQSRSSSIAQLFLQRIATRSYPSTTRISCTGAFSHLAAVPCTMSTPSREK
jgi:hypothetical protein